MSSAAVETNRSAVEKACAQLRGEAAAAKEASAGRGWGGSGGEISVFPAARAIDLVLDLLAAARSAADGTIEARCGELLEQLARRPGAASAEELLGFCDSVCGPAN